MAVVDLNRYTSLPASVIFRVATRWVRSPSFNRNIYLVVLLRFYLALDSFLSLQYTLDRHVRVEAARALYLALIPFLGALTFLLHRLPLHPHRQAFLVSAVLTPIPLPLVDDAGLLLPTRVRQVLAHGPLEEPLATLAAETTGTTRSLHEPSDDVPR